MNNKKNHIENVPKLNAMTLFAFRVKIFHNVDILIG